MTKYYQYCPVAKASELLCERWTMLVLRELVMGSTRFNEIRRGLPKASPTIISKRIKKLEESGVIRRSQKSNQGNWEYTLTEAGKELIPMVELFGRWGRRWVQSSLTKQDLDVGLLMWDMQRRIDTKHLPVKRTVMYVQLTDQKKTDRHWWIVTEAGEVDICLEDPGYDVDLCLTTTLHTLIQIWIGDLSVSRAIKDSLLQSSGSSKLARSMSSWLGKSVFATVKKNEPLPKLASSLM